MATSILDLQLELVDDHGALLEPEALGVDLEALWSPRSVLPLETLLNLPSLDLARGQRSAREPG